MATGTELTLVKGDSLTVTVEIEGVAAADVGNDNVPVAALLDHRELWLTAIMDYIVSLERALASPETV